MNIEKLKMDMNCHIGTSQYFKTIVPNVVYTEGMHDLAETVGAHWFIDIIASYQSEKPANKTEFQIWKIESIDESAKVTMFIDTGESALITQEISFTDFPEGEFEVYAIKEADRTVILLKSEY